MTESATQYQVMCFGEVLWDRIGDEHRPGGAPLNVAYHLTKMNCSAHVISSVGHDGLGGRILEQMRSWGLDTDQVCISERSPTGTVDVSLNDGIPSYTIAEDVAWDQIEVTVPSPSVRHQAPDAIVFGSLAQRSEHNRNSLTMILNATPSARRIFDVNLRPPHSDLTRVRELLQQTDLLKVNEEELMILTSDFSCSRDVESCARALADCYGCSDICVTLGARGAALLEGGIWHRGRAEAVQAVDTVGAGDAFLAALLVGISNGTDRLQALEAATRLAGFVTTRTGATPEYRSRDFLPISPAPPAV